MRRRGIRRTLVAAGVAVIVASGLVVAGVLAFPSGTVGRVATGEERLPVTLEGSVFRLCGPNLNELAVQADAQSLRLWTEGSGGSYSVGVEKPETWRVEATRAGVTVLPEHGGPAAVEVSESTMAAVAFAQQAYECLSRYRFVDETTSLASSSQLVQWYKYDTLVLWPCLTAQGLDVADPPSREDFSDPFRAQSVDPFRDVKVTNQTLPLLLAAMQNCPLRPSYLR
jgi:hypothetical protein